MVVDAGGGRCLLELLVRRIGPREAQVLAHGAVEQVGVLGDHADDAPERSEAEIAHVRAVEQHRALGDVVEPRDQVAERGLAAARLADDRHLGARFGREAHVLQDGTIGLVGERDAVEANLSAHALPREVDRILALLDVNGQVEVLEDAIEQRERRLHVGLHAEQAADWEEEPRLHRGEGHERADRDVGPPARHGVPRDAIDEGRHDCERRLDRGHDPAARHALPQLQFREARRLAPEALRQDVALAHRLAQHHARHRERLLHERRDVGQRALLDASDLSALGTHAACEQHEHGQQPEGHERQLPVEEQHRDRGGDDGSEV